MGIHVCTELHKPSIVLIKDTHDIMVRLNKQELLLKSLYDYPCPLSSNCSTDILTTELSYLVEKCRINDRNVAFMTGLSQTLESPETTQTFSRCARESSLKVFFAFFRAHFAIRKQTKKRRMSWENDKDENNKWQKGRQGVAVKLTIHQHNWLGKMSF